MFLIKEKADTDALPHSRRGNVRAEFQPAHKKSIKSMLCAIGTSFAQSPNTNFRERTKKSFFKTIKTNIKRG
jgi:hypothetical protein